MTCTRSLSPSDDYRELHWRGGRGAEEFYRERWRHDREVRSTHGVNCTGSCSWKVYVKDRIITWETQQSGPRATRARGQGGFVRSDWEEVSELIAAAHVHTIKAYGPDRVVGFVLRLVRGHADRLPAGVRRPDRRARVR